MFFLLTKNLAKHLSSTMTLITKTPLCLLVDNTPVSQTAEEFSSVWVNFLQQLGDLCTKSLVSNVGVMLQIQHCKAYIKNAFICMLTDLPLPNQSLKSPHLNS